MSYVIVGAGPAGVAAAETLSEAAPGSEITLVGDQSIDIRNMVTELENNIISGLILVVLVLLLFLGFTNSLFVGVAIPLSMLIAFIVLLGMMVFAPGAV